METQPRPPKRHPPLRSGVRLLILGVILVSPLLFTACTPPCDIQGYNSMVQLLMKRWDEAVAKAEQSSPEELVTRIVTLKSIKNEMGKLIVPECTFKAHAQLLTTMNYGIAWFSDIQAHAPEETANYDMNNYLIGLDQYHQMLDQLSK